MEGESILEPRKAYDSFLRDKFHKAANDYFSSIVKLGNVDENANRQTVKLYKLADAKANKAQSKAKIAKFWQVFVCVISIIAAIIGGIMIYAYVSSLETLTLVIGIILLILGVVGFILSMTIMRKVSLNTNAIYEKKRQEADKIKSSAYEQLAEMFDYFEWNIPAKLMKEVTPLIQLDDTFDVKKFDYLQERYGFSNIEDQDTSTVCVLSGSVVGNPFLLIRNFVGKMGTKTYVGTRQVFWTESYTDSEGHVRTRTRNQTLTATVTKPCPSYNYDTYLVYGNEAAPDLTFSRAPSGMSGKSEKEIDKFVKKEEDRMIKMSQKALEEGKSFNMMANSEFEALFGALNRNNEQQFRLLFTPLAQLNEIALIKASLPYGDDFYFRKMGKINVIASAHAQRQNIYADPENFVDYDVDNLRKSFVSYMDSFFASLYFDLAPLLSIPLYQQTKPFEYIYKSEYPSNFTSFEMETMANSFNQSNFLHPESGTQGILKANRVKKRGNVDVVEITCHSYKTTPMVDFVPVMAQDGCMYNVEVPWVKYDPLENVTSMGLTSSQTTRHEYKLHKKDLDESLEGPHSFQRGLLAFILKGDYTKKDEERLNQKLNDFCSK